MNTVNWVLRRPSLIGIEILWRWVFGIPAVLLLWHVGQGILDSVPWQRTGIADVSINQLLTDPLRASQQLALFADLIAPGMVHSAVLLAPALLLAWIVVSGVGRAWLFRRLDVRMHFTPLTQMVLQAVRLLPSLLLLGVWWSGLQSLARHTLLSPALGGGEPEMMTYIGGAIFLTLGLFVLGAALGGLFSLAPVVAAFRGQSAVAALRDAFAIPGLSGSLFEINLVMGIVRIALLVLALVFSSTPLPFSTVLSPELLLRWNVGVAIWYVITSDFFHVVQVSSYARLLLGREETAQLQSAV